MEAKNTGERQILLWALLLSSLLGESIWYIRGLLAVSAAEWWSRTVVTLSYYTNLSNIFVIVMAIALLYGRGRLSAWFKSPSLQSAGCLHIGFVGLGFWFILGGPGELNSLLDWIPQLTAHTLSPILGVVYWYRCVDKGQLSWRDPVIWLIYPIGYLVYWLFRGPRVGYYPYFFIDVDALGYGGVAVWSGALLGAFLLLGLLMLFIDRRRA